MEQSPQSFDVCIVCALPEEARAFLEILKQHCEDTLKDNVSSRYQYSYHFATIKNDKDEPLNLHISWLSRYGPQEMILHLSRVLEECQPRIVIMTGICAGDPQQVQLGDLVVAERTFTYDNGKFTFDEYGRKFHLHDTLTYQLDANILQFLGLFDEWKSLVARLKRPPSSSERRKRRTIRCHLKAMASGSAVRADHPFEDIRAPVRGTVAIDMEGAALGLVMSRHPLIRWLVVKGICDYADQTKNDTYHDYAARASAFYALGFIRAYITNERLPRPDRPLSAGQAGIWNVPLLRNPHFTGREELLDRLDQQLSPEAPNNLTTSRRAALTQPQAIKGLGGIGKTQIAVEYAYRSRERDRYTHIFWVNAASEEALLTSFTALTALLPAFPMKDEKDQWKLVEAIKRWLEQCKQRWLLIFDNADDVALVRDYLPQQGSGSILLTTRADAVGGALATPIEVETMGFIEGTQMLLRRAQRFEQASEEEINLAGNIVVALDHFPLALDQAGAYIDETKCSFDDYLQLYQDRRKTLFVRRGMQFTSYPDTVATTWLLSFQKVELTNPAAAELLRLCAFLAPDTIPEELIKDGANQWSPLLQQATTDPFAFNQMIAELLKFSLVKRLADDHMLSIHRLVQAVQMDMMEPEVQHQWAERVVRAVNKVFPHNPKDIAAWSQCLRYLDQVHACYTLIRQHLVQLIEAADLLNRAGLYLLDGPALYSIAESLFRCSLEINEQQLGNEHSSVAISLDNLATLYSAQGKYIEAEQLYQRAFAIFEQQLGPQHPDTVTSLNNLALLYKTQGKHNEAEPLLKRALEIREQQLGPEHPDTAISLNNLALLYKTQKKYIEAESLNRRALEICEQQLGPLHPNTAISLDNLASLYYNQEKYTEAEPLYQRALEIREQQLGSQHPGTAISLNNLALLYDTQKKYIEAEPLYRRALEIQERRLGPLHPDTATVLRNLVLLYKRLGRHVEAESFRRRIYEIDEQQLGPRHPRTMISLNNLVSLYEEQQGSVEAQQLLKRAITIDTKMIGTDQPEVVTDLNNLATLYTSQGKYAEAEPLLKFVLAIREQLLGPTDPDTTNSLNNLANLYNQQGRYVEAEPLYKRVLAICKHILGAEHPTTHTVRKNYVFFLRKLGRDAEARQAEQDL